jgi:hypothetical protein
LLAGKAYGTVPPIISGQPEDSLVPTWIERMFRRECIRRLSAWAAVVLLTALVLTANLRYARNFLYGPFPTTGHEFSKITAPNTAEKYFVKVTGSNVVDTGLQEIEVESRNGVEENRRVSAGYYALVVGNRYLIVKSSNPSPKQLRVNSSSSPATSLTT